MKRIRAVLADLVWRFRARNLRDVPEETPESTPVIVTEPLDPVWLALEKRARERDRVRAMEYAAAEWARRVRFPDEEWLLLWQTMSTDERFNRAMQARGMQ